MEKIFSILIIEDDVPLNDMTKRLLTQHGYYVTSAYSGSEALLLMEKGTFDLILLDLMLPGIPGETVLEKIKSAMDIPIIGVSAKTDIDSKVNLIRNGADDYITKPFDNQELLVRIEAVLRRFQQSSGLNNGKTLHFKDLSLDTEAMEAKIGNTPIALTRYEYLILQLLMSAPSKVFTKNNIFESVWNENFIGDDNAINVHIGNLRKKFAKVKGDDFLGAALETAGLTYVFPDGNGIKNITFQVKRGEIYALYGGHNAGKSVLLQAIIGTLRPQSGTLKLFGNIDYQQERRRIGFVPQKPVTIGSLSPADMLHYFSSAFGSTESRFLDILHLNLKEKKAVRRLPLSTQRLVNLAVALLGNPDMIILDDPFSGLDKGECEHLLSVLTYLHEMNHTTLLISGQDYTLLSRLASKYGVMADGKLLCELTTGELKESCQRCIKIRTPQLERVITILSQQFPDFEVLGHDLIRIFHCNEQSGEINTLLVRSGIEVSEIWLAGMEPTDYLLKMTGGAKSDSDDAK